MAANEDSPPTVVTELRDNFKVSFEEEMLTLTPRSSIVDLKNCNEVIIIFPFWFIMLSNVVIWFPLYTNEANLFRVLLMLLLPLLIAWLTLALGGILHVSVTKRSIRQTICIFARSVIVMWLMWLRGQSLPLFINISLSHLFSFLWLRYIYSFVIGFAWSSVSRMTQLCQPLSFLTVMLHYC